MRNGKIITNQLGRKKIRKINWFCEKINEPNKFQLADQGKKVTTYKFAKWKKEGEHT